MADVSYNNVKITIEFTPEQGEMASGETLAALLAKAAYHVSDGSVHVTASEKEAWDGKADISATRLIRDESVNNLLTPGVYGILTGVTPDAPDGYGSWGLIEVRSFGSIIYQSIRYETGAVINRAEIKDQVDWSEWQRTNDGGNASMLGGKSASDFACRYNSTLDEYLAGKSGDIRELAYLLPVGGYTFNTNLFSSHGLSEVTGFPVSGDIFMVWLPSYWAGSNLYYGMLVLRPLLGGPLYMSTIYNTTAYTAWNVFTGTTV